MKTFYFLCAWIVDSAPHHVLRHLSPRHHILSVTDECPCATTPSPSGRKCACLRDDVDYLDSVVDQPDEFDQTVTELLPADNVDIVVLNVTATTTTVSPYAKVQSAVSPTTDLDLLTLYKGTEASDRPGIADYGDLLQDFHSGWTVWPSDKILFQFDFGVSNCVQTIVNVAVSVLNTHTCLNMVEVGITPAIDETVNPILHISEKSSGCFASLGYRPGNNLVNVGSGCVSVGTVLHLLLHSVGLFHEHQRPDRDNFVAVHSLTVDPTRMGGSVSTSKFSAVFGKVDASDPIVNDTKWLANLGPYDYASIMHNGPCHYSTSEEFGGKDCVSESTLVALNTTIPIGNRQMISQGDIARICAIYSCAVPDMTDPAKLADPVTAESTLCTLADAQTFAWSDLALTGKPAQVVVVAASATTLTPTSNPNEYAAFEAPLSTSSDTQILWVLAIAVLAVFLIAGTFMYLAHRNRVAKRTGRSRRVRAPPRDADMIGESSDSEVFAEIATR